MECCTDSTANNEKVIENVKKYYGKVLNSLDDLQTLACTTPAQKTTKHLSDAIEQIHDEVVSKYYGCGLVAPASLENMNILDLGCGSGRDCYVLSKLAGRNGFVTGLDMTNEQLEVANRHVDYHMKVFGFEKPNVKFMKGYIENLEDAGIEDNSVDIIVSNCVINLCKDKKKVFSEAYRVLRTGGELYFSDVYVDREFSDEVRSNQLLWGECVSGALHWKQLFNLAAEIGFETPRTVSLHSFDITKPELKAIVGDAKFASVMYRLFKLPKDLKHDPSKVVYNGSIIDHEEELKFDVNWTFKKDESIVVDGSTSAILQHSRFKNNFTFERSSNICSIKKDAEENPFVLLRSGNFKSTNAKSCCC